MADAEASGLHAGAGDDSEPEDLRLGYQSAIALWTYEGNLVWSKFNAMLVANSVVAAIIGL